MANTPLQTKRFGVGLTANDLDRSLRFYTEGLGFDIEERMEENGKLQGVMLKAGSASVGLTQDDFKKGRDRVKGVGMSIYVETDQDIPALADRAKKAGIDVKGPEAMPWGPMGFQATDPDGFKITVANPEPAKV